MGLTKVGIFKNVLTGMTRILEENIREYDYNINKGLIPQIEDTEATAIIDLSNKTFTVNLFTSVEFLSKIPGDGFHDFLTMGRNDTFKEAKSEFIFIYILGNFMKNITCMKTDENKDTLIANTLYTYAAAMNLDVNKLDEPEAAASRSTSRTISTIIPTQDSVSKDGLGDGNDIAHRVMTTRTDIMTGTGICNKIGQTSEYQSDFEKTMNILYYVDTNGGILDLLYKEWVSMCNSNGIVLHDPMPAPGNVNAADNNARNGIIKTTATESVEKVDVDILFAKATPANTPEWYKMQYVKNTLAKYTEDYVYSLYQVFVTKHITSTFTLKPEVLPIYTIPFLQQNNNKFLDEFEDVEKIRDMEFDLAELLFNKKFPIYFFADANHGKVGPGILRILRQLPVLLIESSVIDMDEASEGFSKTTLELNKFINNTVVNSNSNSNSNTKKDKNDIIAQIKNGETFTFNFYSENGCLIEQFIISKSAGSAEKVELQDKVSELLEVSDFTTLKKKEDFIEDVLMLFITHQTPDMIASITANIDLSGISANRLIDRIQYIITDNGEKIVEKDEDGNTVMVTGKVEIKKKGKSLTPPQFEEALVPKALHVSVSGAQYILIKIQHYLDNDNNLQITNRFVSTPDITQISVNNMSNIAVDNLTRDMDILVPQQEMEVKKKGKSIPKYRPPSELLRLLYENIIKEFGSRDDDTSQSTKKQKLDPELSSTQKSLIGVIQNFLTPLTAKRTGDLLPLCLWGFLKDNPNKFYDTGDLNAYELGLLLLTSPKNVGLFQDLLLACPGTDEVQDYLRLVRCGDNSKLFSTEYTGPPISEFVPGVSLPNTTTKKIPKGSSIQKDAITIHIKPLHDCIPPIFNPTVILDPNDPKDPCPTSFQEVQALNSGATPMIIQETESPDVGASELVEGQMDTEAAKAAAMDRVENATIASGVPAPKRKLDSEQAQPENLDPEKEEPDVKKIKSEERISDSQPYWNNEEAEAEQNKMIEGGQKRKKLKTIKKRKPRVQRKTIKIKTKTKPLK